MISKRVLIASVLAAAASTALPVHAAGPANGTVYHFNDTAAQGLAGLRNMRNHLDTDPGAKLVAVTHGAGIDMLLEGAKASDGTELAPLVAALKARGARFEVCEITIKGRNLRQDQFIQEADFTPSGVVLLARLQHEGYAYIKP